MKRPVHLETQQDEFQGARGLIWGLVVALGQVALVLVVLEQWMLQWGALVLLDF